MKSALETLSPTRVKLTVEVPYEELKPSLEQAYQTIGSQIQVPGFRRGKVPARIIDQRLGKGAVLQEAVNDALPKFYGQALEEHSVRPLGQPEVDVTDVPLEDDQMLKFTAEVDKRPDIHLPDYSGIAVEVDAIEVDDADIEERLTTLRQRFGTLKGVERAATAGDFVSIDLTAQIDGAEIDTVSGVSYEVGSANMLEGMDEAITGLSAGDTTTFSAPLAGGEHAGLSAECTVVVQSVKERELPALDDDFAQLASEFDTLDELKVDLRKEAERGKRYGQGLQARDKVMAALLEAVEIPVPEAIVEQEVHQHLEGEGRLEDAEHRAEVQAETRKGLATQFLLDAIVEAEGVKVEQPELIEYLLMSAQQYGMDPNQFAQSIDAQGQIPAMIGEVGRRKALAVVLERATVTDTAGNPIDLEALSRESAQPEHDHNGHEHEHEHDDHDHDHDENGETGRDS
ncbi:MAG: trigger factor [Actinomycetales bacterium]|nr:trigger factor [Actinomycetales bacterium]